MAGLAPLDPPVYAAVPALALRPQTRAVTGGVWCLFRCRLTAGPALFQMPMTYDRSGSLLVKCKVVWD